MLPPVFHEHHLFGGHAEEIGQSDHVAVAGLDMHYNRLGIGNIHLRERGWEGKSAVLLVNHGIKVRVTLPEQGKLIIREVNAV